MAILKTGQVGDFNGKIGQVVVSKWRELTVGRSTPKKSTKKATEEQLDQQSKFKLVTTFVSRVGKSISLGYQNSAGNLTPYNVAVRYHLENAVTGQFPNYSLDMSKVRLSGPRDKTEIDGVGNVAMSNAVDGVVTLTWTKKNLSINEFNNDADLLNVVFYNVTENAFMTAYADGSRASLTGEIRVPQEKLTDVIHGWMYLISTNKKFISKSVYLGLVKV